MNQSDNENDSKEIDSIINRLIKYFDKKEFRIENGENFDEIISRSIDDALNEDSIILFNNFEAEAASLLEENQKDLSYFLEHHNKIWKIPIDLLELFLIISTKVGADFNKEIRPIAAKENDFVFEALTRLHARGCQTGREILTLLQNGYAAGAHARWRTLHEIAIIGYFIREKGNETAERYLLHHHIESCHSLKKYQEYAEKLGYKPFTAVEIESINSICEKLCGRFGQDYKNEYGWASAALHKSKPKIADLEKEVSIEHLRPFYRMASHPIHAGPKGVFFDLGLPPSYRENLLIAGASNFGLTDPGHSTAISLNQLTTTLLLTKPTYQHLVIAKAMRLLVDEIGSSFLKVQASLKE
jgi:hypothetical protein